MLNKSVLNPWVKEYIDLVEPMLGSAVSKVMEGTQGTVLLLSDGRIAKATNEQEATIALHSIAGSFSSKLAKSLPDFKEVHFLRREKIKQGWDEYWLVVRDDIADLGQDTGVELAIPAIARYLKRQYIHHEGDRKKDITSLTSYLSCLPSYNEWLDFLENADRLARVEGIVVLDLTSSPPLMAGISVQGRTMFCPEFSMFLAEFTSRE